MDARSYSRLPPYTRARKLSEPFFFASTPCICWLTTCDLRDELASFFQKMSLSQRFLSLFSVFLRTRPQAKASFHAGLRGVVESELWMA
jgi:hypothetical protein